MPEDRVEVMYLYEDGKMRPGKCRQHLHRVPPDTNLAGRRRTVAADKETRRSTCSTRPRAARTASVRWHTIAGTDFQAPVASEVALAGPASAMAVAVGTGGVTAGRGIVVANGCSPRPTIWPPTP